jgi:hypothetical protein
MIANELSKTHFAEAYASTTAEASTTVPAAARLPHSHRSQTLSCIALAEFQLEVIGPHIYVVIDKKRPIPSITFT